MSIARTITALRKAALAYPETREDHPWGECAFKVKEKVFLFLGKDEDELRITFKLPASRDFAMLLPFASPTAYGLGKSGWITCTFEAKEPIPLPMMLDWLDESFRAVAPKKLSATVPSRRG